MEKKNLNCLKVMLAEKKPTKQMARRINEERPCNGFQMVYK